MVSTAYSACLDPDGTSKRKPVFYHATGDILYHYVYTDPGSGQTPYYTVEVDYTKAYHYKSTMDSSRNQDNIATIEKSFSGDNNGYGPGTNGWMVDENEALAMVGEFKNDSLVSIKSGAIQNLLKQNVAIVIEQPVIYNELTNETWGFCDLYATTKGEKVDPEDPNSGYSYNYSDLVKLDTDKIYSYFGATFQADMDARKTAAGLEVVILSSE
jgi:hypothetical protein